MLRGQIVMRLSVLILVLFISIVGTGAAAAERHEDLFLQLYREPYQGAFHMLIPKGWKAEGGMIPSGAQWNVVDLVENNIRFRVTQSGWKVLFRVVSPFLFPGSSDYHAVQRGDSAASDRPGAQWMLALPLSQCGPVCAIYRFWPAVSERISKSQNHREHGAGAGIETRGCPKWPADPIAGT